jgi:hypothetical protein
MRAATVTESHYNLKDIVQAIDMIPVVPEHAGMAGTLRTFCGPATVLFRESLVN